MKYFSGKFSLIVSFHVDQQHMLTKLSKKCVLKIFEYELQNVLKKLQVDSKNYFIT